MLFRSSLVPRNSRGATEYTSSLLPSTYYLFKSEQPLLHIDSCGEAGDGAGGSDDAVAGEEDGEWVLVEGLSGGAWTWRGAGGGGDLCDLEICAGFAVGDGPEGVPDALLIGCAQGGKGPCPGSGTASGEVVVKPEAGVFQRLRRGMCNGGLFLFEEI